MPTSFVCVLECEIQDWAKNGIEKIEKCIEDLKEMKSSELFSECQVPDFNYLLYSSSPEENEFNGVSNYFLPE